MPRRRVCTFVYNTTDHEDTGAGLVTSTDDPEAIAEAVNRLLANEALRAEVSAQARAARRRYCWE